MMELLTPPFPYAGEWAALGTSVFWTLTALFMESAGRRVGSLVVNLFRLVLGFLYLALFGLLMHGEAFPLSATAHQWNWLLLSGVVGFVLADLCLFQAFLMIGSRLSLAFYTSVPPFTALFDWLFLGHELGLTHLAGMGVTCFGLLLVQLDGRHRPGGSLDPMQRRRGMWLALLGSIGQAGGLILSKIGMDGMDPFAATQIRLVAGMAGFALIFTIWRHWGRAWRALRDWPACWRIGIGTIFGPFLGISFSLLALQYAKAGLVATLTSLSPVFIIAPSVWFFKERIGWMAVGGAVLAVAGSAVIFL